MKRTYTLTLEGQGVEAEVWDEAGDYRVNILGHVHTVSVEPIRAGRLFSLLIDGRSYEVYAQRRGEAFELVLGSMVYEIEAHRGGLQQRARLARGGTGLREVRSPMTGIVTEVAVGPGQAVERGDVLFILESMKMNNELRAERSGIIESVHVTAGDRVERGKTLLRLDVDERG